MQTMHRNQIWIGKVAKEDDSKKGIESVFERNGVEQRYKGNLALCHVHPISKPEWLTQRYQKVKWFVFEVM